MDEVVKKIRAPKGSTQTAAPKAARAGAPAKAATAAPAAKALAATASSTKAPARQPRKAAPGAAAETDTATLSVDRTAAKSATWPRSAAPALSEQPASTPAARQAKMVRGSFSVPKDELAVLAELKQACLKDGIEVKKSQLLRVAITLLRELDAARLGQMVAGLPATAARQKKNK